MRSIQSIQAVSSFTFKVKLDVEMRIAIFLIHTSAFLRYLLYSMFAFRSCLIVRLFRNLAVDDALGILGSFGLGVDIGWENAVHLAREFGGELGTSDELGVWET